MLDLYMSLLVSLWQDVFDHFLFPLWQDVFDLPFHMARDQIEESLRTKMTSIKV